jgi:hypothetical protein
MSKILCKISDEDARTLSDSIIEVETAERVRNEAMGRTDCTPEVLRVIMDYHIHALQAHKALWRDILIKYIGEDEASRLYQILRFDMVKNVIFEMEIEGCALCSSKSN